MKIPQAAAFMRMSRRTSILTAFQTFPQIITLIDEQVGSQPLIIAYQQIQK